MVSTSISLTCATLFMMLIRKSNFGARERFLRLGCADRKLNSFARS